MNTHFLNRTVVWAPQEPFMTTAESDYKDYLHSWHFVQGVSQLVSCRKTNPNAEVGVENARLQNSTVSCIIVAKVITF
jgi:hypothetical protein